MAMGGHWGKVKVGEVTSMKLVDEARDFLGEIAQLAELAKQHLISAHPLLPAQCPPTDIVLSPASKMVNDFTLALWYYMNS